MFRGKKQSLFNRLATIVFIVSLLLPFINPAFVQADDAGDIDDLALQAVRNNYGFYQEGQAVDGVYGNFSAYDAYILDAAGAELDSWIYDREDFTSRVMSLADSSIADEGTANQSSAKRIAGEYLAARSMGEDDQAAELLQILQNRQAASGDGSFDSSAFSDIPALEILGRAGDIDKIDTDQAISLILGGQDSVSGAWAYDDLMTTAEAIRALTYLEPYAGDQEQEMSDAIERGLEWLAAGQIDDGSFQYASWEDPVVNTSEVVYTLGLRGINPESWVSGEGNSPIDYLLHEAENSDGTFGTYKNIAANTWVLDAYLQMGAAINRGNVLGLEVSPSSAVIDKGEAQQFTAEAYTFAGTTEDVTSNAIWTVEDPNLASIDMGLATGIAAGTTAVTAEYEEASNSADVTVQDSSSPGDLDDLALQAVRNNYGFYQAGQAVDGVYGNFSAYDAYILDAAGAELDSWIYDREDFTSRVMSLADSSIADEGTANQSSAKRIAGEYLAARSMGEDDQAAELLQILQNRQAASGDGSFDSSAFSDIPALEILGRAGDIDKIDTDQAISLILGGQDSVSGAWAYDDLMTTAEAIRALTYLEPYAGDQEQEMSDAIERGLEWLAAGQIDDGSFQYASWEDPVVNTSEVVYTLGLRGINPESWVSGEGNSPIDYLLHEAENSDGTFGTYKNIAANTWVLDAYLQMGAAINRGNVLGLEVSPSSAVIDKGEAQQFTAEAYTLAGTTEEVTSSATWAAEDTDIASINEGLATGMAAGMTSITAGFGGISGSALLTVENSDSTGGSHDSDDNIKIYIAVVGSDGELLFSPQRVTMDPDDTYGLTAVGALDATGLSWSYTTGLVTDIEGQSNENMNGWMCKISDVPLSISAFESEVEPGDEVIWWYSYDPYSDGPAGDDLFRGSIIVPSAAVMSPLAQSIEDIISLYSEQLEQLQGKTSVINADKQMNAEQLNARQNELDNNQVFIQTNVNEDETLIVDELQEIAVLVPAHAVSETVVITIDEVAEDSIPQQFALRIGSSVYQFGPDGSKFNQPLTICIQMAITGDMNIDRLSPAWYDTGKNEWIPIPAIIDLETGLIIFRIDHFTAFSVVDFPTRSSFPDVNNGINWAREAIEVLAGQGIIKGTGTGFEPGRYISRAEFVQLMVKALNLSSTADSGMSFTDVRPGDWFADAVETACASGIISGYPDATFRPDKPITRNEIASILQRLQPQSDLTGGELSYADQSEIPTWALAGLRFTCQAKLMNGYEDGTFRGHNSLSRAEAAVTVYRYLNYLVVTGYEL